MERQRFISLRWRFIVPLYVMILLIVAPGAYLVATNAGAESSIAPANIAAQSRRTIIQQSATIYETQRRAAQSAAIVSGLPQALESGQYSLALRSSLQNRARRAGLDSLILVDANGEQALGLRFVADQDQYVFTAPLESGDDSFIRSAAHGQDAAGFLTVGGETLLYTAVPVQQDGAVIGAVLAGNRLNWVMSTLHTSALTEVSLYNRAGTPLVTTLAGASSDSVRLSSSMFDRAIQAEQQMSLKIGGVAYDELYFPLVYGPQTIGVVGVALPQNIGFGFGRQLTGLLLAALSAAVVIFAFVGMGLVTRRIQRATRVAQALAAGQFTARTRMQPTDEIGMLGKALDTYADYAQARQDSLRASLRRQRREQQRLTAVLDTLPDGVVVQDLNGQVVVMNESARQLLGAKRLLRGTPDLSELTGLVTDRLGQMLVPGIQALGDAQRVELDGKALTVEAAAVTTITDQRIGNLIVLRDISHEARLADARKALLQRIENEVQQPLADLAQPLRPAPMKEVAREIRQHTASLQKMVVELRELSDLNLRKMPVEEQHPILLDTLVWAVANEWRQVAQAQNLKLHVVIEKSGLYVLGQERRLRWAIGNLIDNAIKYTPPGGDLMLEIRDNVSDGQAHLRLRDNGVGIGGDDLPHVFARFYRGKPVTKEGRAIRVSGSGQGLTTARQIFEAHGGALTLKSKQWVGTGAYFTIPLTAPVSIELPQIAADLEGETVRIDARSRHQRS